MNSPVRLGVIGLGSIGSRYAQDVLDGYVPRLKLTAICNRSQKSLRQFDPHAQLQHFSSAEDLIRAGSVDAVLIATPHYSHTTIGIAALQAGLHVLVDKPISVHTADCQRLLQAHQDKTLVFAAMFNQRTDPRYAKLRDMVQSGELGQINRINWIVTDWFRSAIYYSASKWGATWAGEGGGILMNQCPHQLDLWQWIFGMPASVRAFCQFGRYHDIEVEDDVTTYMEYADGATGVFVATTGEAPGTDRLEVAGDLGRVVVEGDKFIFDKNKIATSVFVRTSTDGFAKSPVRRTTLKFKKRGTQHRGIMLNFVNAILDGEQLLARAEEGIRSVELANAMIFSSMRKQMVRLPLDPDAYGVLLKKLCCQE